MATDAKSSDARSTDATPTDAKATDGQQADTWRSAKDKMIAVLEKQPADSSYDELLRELELAAKIERGLADAAAGRVISHEEVKRRIMSWWQG